MIYPALRELGHIAGESVSCFVPIQKQMPYNRPGGRDMVLLQQIEEQLNRAPAALGIFFKM